MTASEQNDRNKPRRGSGRGGGPSTSSKRSNGGRGRGRGGSRGSNNNNNNSGGRGRGSGRSGRAATNGDGIRRSANSSPDDVTAAKRSNERRRIGGGKRNGAANDNDNDRSGGRRDGRSSSSSSGGASRDRARTNAVDGNIKSNGKRNDGPNGNGKETSKGADSRSNNDRNRRNNNINKNSNNGNNSNSNNGNNNGNSNGSKRNNNNRSRAERTLYEAHASLPSILERYASCDPNLVRGRIRVLPARNGTAFVTCDRGSQSKDVVVGDERDRNRAMDGDTVFVELFPAEEEEERGDGGGGGRANNGGASTKGKGGGGGEEVTVADFMGNLKLNGDGEETGREEKRNPPATEKETEEIVYEEEEYLIDQQHDGVTGGKEESEGETGDEGAEMWHDDKVQMSLWDPVVNLRKKSRNAAAAAAADDAAGGPRQRRGKVIFVVPPKCGAGQQPSELAPAKEIRRDEAPRRTVVGRLTRLPNGGRYLLVPNDKSLPRFMCPAGTDDAPAGGDKVGEKERGDASGTLYRAEYVHGSWRPADKWPPCRDVRVLCDTGNAEGETKALLVENGVDHGDFPPAALRDVERSVKSGTFVADDGGMGWRPSPDMLEGRRDYRNHRVFTIDPTTARDLDDALHVTPLPDGRVEIGVHIADVSHFLPPAGAVDREALRRATTVYLVNGIVPMLPRPLCEIACSLNENVERLAFSCVWTMNANGTLGDKKGGGKGKGKNGRKGAEGGGGVWYGRTVIKSCARLDYATAQNIIDGKVADGEPNIDETLWPRSRRPTGGHTVAEVAGDVRLMHKVAMARRRLRFGNGALALNGVKLAFQLEDDGETPRLCAPYPLRDSNRLVEEYMLLANYLVAQRLVTHARGRALLRHHPPPIETGMQAVVDVSRESFDFDIDTTSSATLQESLSRLSRECDDELIVQCVTESLTTPMRPAEYLAAGEADEEEWAHFALNVPYYTHFTSPIRRYPDVVVHRLLQATLDDGSADKFDQSQKEIQADATHCNEMRMNAKKAQERSDRVFLSLYLKKNPIASTLGVCLGVGEKTFTVFVPSLGMSARVFLQEHEDEFEANAFEDEDGRRRIVIRPRTAEVPGMQPAGGVEGAGGEGLWKSLDIRVFTKLEVACTCKPGPPIDVRVKAVGPWRGATVDG